MKMIKIVARQDNPNLQRQKVGLRSAPLMMNQPKNAATKIPPFTKRLDLMEKLKAAVAKHGSRR